MRLLLRATSIALLLASSRVALAETAAHLVWHKTPTGWTAERGSPPTLLTYRDVGADGDTALVEVLDLGDAQLPDVERTLEGWRGELGVPARDASRKPLLRLERIAGHQIGVATLGPGLIVVVVGPVDAHPIYFKLSGPAKAIARARPKLKRLLFSLELPRLPAQHP